jgi:hypothetical protein
MNKDILRALLGPLSLRVQQRNFIFFTNHLEKRKSFRTFAAKKEKAVYITK